MWKNFRVHQRLVLDTSIIEDVYGILAGIDGIKNSWHITGRLLPQTLERLTHSVIITSTGSSNRIEGNRLTDTDVERLYQNLYIKKFKTRDEQEIAGYIECLEHVFSHYNEIDLTESALLHLHHEMLRYSEKDAHHMGDYKKGSNRVEAKDPSGNVVGIIFDPTPPYLVKKEIQELLEWYHWATHTKVKHPLILIANFIFEFLAIHPFQDGNGRISRLLTNLLLLQQGYLFASIVSHERLIESSKGDYYLALNKTQRTWKTELETIAPWLFFFLNTMNIQSAQALEMMKNENIESLLSEKQLALWKWASVYGAAFSRKDAVQVLGFPERTVEASIKKLMILKRLNRQGEGRATRYVVSSLGKF